MLFMTHPDLPEHAPAVTTQEAFDGVWKDKGWEIVEDDTDTAPAESIPPPPPANPKPPTVVVPPKTEV